MLKKISLLVLLMIFAVIVVHEPMTVSEPAASPYDHAKENLTRIEYPSVEKIKWKAYFMRPQDSLEYLFGNDWPHVARFNRIDRRHAYPGMTIRVPENMADIRNYTPMPDQYEPAKRYHKYILVNLTEQWLGAYENGKLKFSMPAASGTSSNPSPVGVFRVDARHRNHTSSLYKTEDQQAQYPMDYAFRFHIGKDNVSYWIHARDLPGKPASHGCIGVYDESMQNRMYGIPGRPVLDDAKKLYAWAVGDDYDFDSGELELLEDGPIVEVTGGNPTFRSSPFENILAGSPKEGLRSFVAGLFN